jgi:hypothetical protein
VWERKMKIAVKPEITDMTYYVKYKEAFLELAKQERRLPLVTQLLKDFEIRLNDVQFNEKTPSDNWIHFTKFYGEAFFNVSLGLEELTARLTKPKDEKMVVDLYGKLVQNIRPVEYDVQRFISQRHFSTTESATSFLRELNPNHPVGFGEMLEGNGVFYTLRSEANNMTVHITLANSLAVPGGLFLSVENSFWPNQFDFEKAFGIAKEFYAFIVDQLNVIILQA